jgi:endonuclease/exonuclease/phosphatase family metal-dependent hydrolase
MTTLRVATFNVLHGMVLPTPGAVQPAEDALAAAVRELDADVLGLQEVDRGQPRSQSLDQTKVVAEALGAPHWRFVPTLYGTPGGKWSDATVDSDGEADGTPAYGIALVSRLPVSEWRLLRMPTARIPLPLIVPADNERGARIVPVVDEPRAALAAVIDGPDGHFTVITTHLSFVPGVNARQLRRIVRWADDLPSPTFLVGDLNLPGRLAWRIAGWKPLALQPTYPTPAPRVQFDHVLVDELSADSLIATRTHALGVSDHRALSADVRLP